MIFRGIDGSNDWAFGNGRQSYFTGRRPSPRTSRLGSSCFLGNVFSRSMPASIGGILSARKTRRRKRTSSSNVGRSSSIPRESSGSTRSRRSMTRGGNSPSLSTSTRSSRRASRSPSLSPPNHAKRPRRLRAYNSDDGRDHRRDPQRDGRLCRDVRDLRGRHQRRSELARWPDAQHHRPGEAGRPRVLAGDLQLLRSRQGDRRLPQRALRDQRRDEEPRDLHATDRHGHGRPGRHDPRARHGAPRAFHRRGRERKSIRARRDSGFRRRRLDGSPISSSAPWAREFPPEHDHEDRHADSWRDGRQQCRWPDNPRFDRGDGLRSPDPAREICLAPLEGLSRGPRRSSPRHAGSHRGRGLRERHEHHGWQRDPGSFDLGCRRRRRSHRDRERDLREAQRRLRDEGDGQCLGPPCRWLDVHRVLRSADCGKSLDFLRRDGDRLGLSGSDLYPRATHVAPLLWDQRAGGHDIDRDLDSLNLTGGLGLERRRLERRRDLRPAPRDVDH